MKRRATKIFSVRLGKRLPVALMTMALAAANMAFAQEENPWVGEALPAEGGEFYLYNKSGDGFLLGANTWGTQGSLGQPGLLCTVVVSNGKYKIVTVATVTTGAWAAMDILIMVTRLNIPSLIPHRMMALMSM